MKRRIFILFLLISATCLSQKEASKWLFGEKVGLQFLNLTDPPLVLRGELNTLEGCASIADSNGNLLFYSDGSTVWDKNDDIMPNGTDLLGDESSTQSAIIIPKPLDPNIYYLFTVGSTIVPTGYNYYTIDLSLNGGLGEVVGSNFNLTDGHGGSDWSEKITAVQGGECNTFWVISLVKDLYYSYKVDVNGVDPNPVISQVDFLSDASRGYLKVSPDGSKIVAAHQSNDMTTSGCFLYSFDHITGQVINDGISLFPNSIEQSYGVEFSPQASKLYVSTILPDSNVYKLYQFDLTSNNIPNSKILIHSENDAFRGALQLGPDLKIYATIPKEYTVGTNYLDVIHNPELDGLACDFDQDYIFFGSDSYSMQGLPPFIQSFFYTQRINIVNPFEPVTPFSSDLSLCQGSSYTLQGPEIPGADYQWTFSFGGGSINLPAPNPPHELIINELGSDSQGTYELVVTSNDVNCDIQYLGEANVSFTHQPSINPLVTLTNCDFFDNNPTDGFTMFNLHNSLHDISNNPGNTTVYYYLNATDAENDIYNQNSLPQYYMNTFPNQVLITKVFESDSECYSLGQLQLIVTPTTILNTPDISNCDTGNGTSIFDLDEKENNLRIQNFLPATTDIVFYNTLENAIDKLDPISSFYESNNAPIYFYAVNNGACIGSGIFNLIVNPLPPINQDDTNLTICQFDFPLILNSSIDYGIEQLFWYEWTGGQTTNEIIIDIEQVLTVKVIDKTTGCENSKTYNISKKTPPNITEVDVNINTATVTIYTQENENLAYAMDNSNGIYQPENVFNDVAPGIHNVYVSNDCGITQKQIYVLGFPKFFTPNEDGSNDTWKVKGLDTGRLSISNIQIFDRYGKLLITLEPDSEWNGIYNGEKLPPSDYWFSISIKDQNDNTNIYKGHFSLVQ